MRGHSGIYRFAAENAASWEWMNQGVKDMGLYLCFAFSGAKDR